MTATAVVLAEIELSTLLFWVVIVPPVGAAVTWLAGRLLGAQRGWVALLSSGFAGFTLGVIFAGAVTDWAWRSWSMVGLTVVFGTVLTMVIAVGLDLIRPPGSLHRGDEAGLVKVSGRPHLGSMLSPVSRYRELLGLARKNDLLSQRWNLSDPASAAELGPHLRATLEQAGGLFVKLGQVASTRSDLLPPAVCDELAELRSSAKPAPRSEVQPLVEAELGRSVDAAFTEFDWEPIASASIAQVYAATNVRGERVVVKVQRPGLEALVERDSAALMQLAGLLERRTTMGLRLSPTGLASEFLDGIREELDFTREAANALALGAATPENSGVRIPFIDLDLTTPTLLVEERVDGIPISDVTGLHAAGHDPVEVARRLLRVTLAQMFRAGVFHADPHPGNLLVEPDGTIVMIDLGAVGRLSKQQRSVIMQVIVAASSGDAALLRQSLEPAGITTDGVDSAALDRAIDEFLVRHTLVSGGLDASMFEDLLVILGDFGLRPPRWMAGMGRMLVTLQGTLSAIDPNFSLVDAALEQAHDLLGPDFSEGSLRELAASEAMLQLPRLRRLPQRLDELMGQAAQGRLSVRMSLLSNQSDVDTLTTLVNRVVLAVLAAAMGIGSVLLLRAGRDGTDITVDEVLGYVGLAVSAILTLRIVAGVVRDGRT
jgi:ubiquinone biosynthesis protein